MTGFYDVVVTQGSQSDTLVGAFEYKLWTPANITTTLWLDAADSATITLDGSSNVEQWDDKSGNTRHFGETSAANRPPVGSAALNGKDVISFNGSSQRLWRDSVSLHSGEWSVFAVANSDVGSRFASLIDQDDSTGSASRIAQYLRQNNSTGFDTIAFNTAGAAAVASQVVTQTDPHIYGATRSTSVLTPYADGTAGTTASPSGTANTGTNRVAVGARYSTGAFGQYWDGDIAEIVFLPGVATTDQRQKIEGYLAHKWGLEANLPAAHPYKSSPP